MSNHPLTLQDMRALRSADSICFDHLPDGTDQIRAIVRADRSSTGFEQTHTVPVTLARLDNYGDPVGETWSGFHMVMSAQYDAVWRTMVKRLRQGREIALIWTRGNNTPILNEVGLVQDELRLRVATPGKTDAEEFLVRVQVGHDNTARMIRASR